MAVFNVIQYEGDSGALVWKSPIEDFNTGSQLVVGESQEALFFKNGQALDLFGPGRHALSTQNIPLIRRLVSLPFGGEPPSSATCTSSTRPSRWPSSGAPTARSSTWSLPTSSP